MTRSDLPQLSGTTMLTDSGIETDVIFNVGRDLPNFAVFPLLDDEEGRAILERYYRAHLAVAAEHGFGYMLETPSWRSNPEQGMASGYAQVELDRFDREGVAFLRSVLASSGFAGPTAVSGLLGPRGDGYVVGVAMSADEAHRYHAHQVEVLTDAGVDLIGVLTLTYAAEGVGVVRAARDAGVPVAVAFTVETDGRLPDGSSLADAIRTVDEATDGYAAYFGINCAHPDHVRRGIDDGDWVGRVSWLRANASRRSHEELDEAPDLDDGDPAELGEQYAELRGALPALTVLGGCCGTDVRHVAAIASSLAD